MGRSEPARIYHSPEPVPARTPSPAPQRRRRPRRRPHHVRNILLVGSVATVLIGAGVRAHRLDMECRQAKESCVRMEAEIGELVVADSALTDPGRVQRIAISQGYAPPAGSEQVAVNPALLPPPSAPPTGEPKGPPPQLAAWAGVGSLAP